MEMCDIKGFCGQIILDIHGNLTNFALKVAKGNKRPYS